MGAIQMTDQRNVLASQEWSESREAPKDQAAAA